MLTGSIGYANSMTSSIGRFVAAAIVSIGTLEASNLLFDYAEQLKTEGWEEGLEQGIEQGLEQGREEGRMEGAIKLSEFLKASLSIDDALARMQNEAKIAV